MLQADLSLMGLLSIAGVSVALMAAVLLWRIPFGDSRANRLLSALMFILALILLQRCLSAVGVVYRYPHLQGIAGPFNFLVGPMLYLYLRSMSESSFRLTTQHLWHGLPMLLSLLLYLPVYASPAELKQAFVSQYLAGYEGSVWNGGRESANIVEWINLCQNLAAGIVLGAYAYASIRRLSIHRRALTDNFSETERLTLSWLGNLAWLALFAMAASLLALLLTRYSASLLSPQLLPTLLLLAICCYGGYQGICQPLIEWSVENGGAQQQKQQDKYLRSGLSEEGQGLLWQQLQQYMASKKPYLQGGLTIGQLAADLEMPAAYLSQTINAEAGVSFFDYINRARINEAKVLLRQPGSKPGLSTLYLEVGFNSKSSFYTQFKKYSDGKTPSQWENS